MRPTVRFVFLSTMTDNGSTLMRAHQLCNFVKPFLDNQYDIGLEEIDFSPSLLPGRFARPLSLQKWAKRQKTGSILIFTKACLRRLNEKTIHTLRKRQIRICFDHVDSDFRSTAGLAPDVHICTSYAQRDAIEQHQAIDPSFTGKALVLLHNYDEALLQHVCAQHDTFRCGYIGTPGYGYLPDAVTQQIDVVPARGRAAWQHALKCISDYNLHYCLRTPQPKESRLVKPFTKGFVAAQLGAVIIVNRQTEDAEAMLGADYPYMVERLDEKLTIDMLEKAKYEFGSNLWQEARERMVSVADAVSPQALAKQLSAILDYLKA